MARQLRWWIGAALLVCAVVGFAYLPPRATPLFARRYQVLGPTPYRLRVQQLADAWRSAALELRLLQYRERLRPELERRRTHDVPGPAVLMDWTDASDSLRRVVAATLDAEWIRLGLGASKVSVGVVLALDRATVDSEPSQDRMRTAYLLPDSTDRWTCIVLQTSTSVTRWPGELNLGPCAFYAAFGAPGREIGRWLRGRRFDLALIPQWAPGVLSGRYDFLVPQRRQPWFWGQVYSYSPDGVACLAGRPQRCQDAVLGSVEAPGSATPVVTTAKWWQRQALVAGHRYLAHVARSVGSERFLRFWNSELPVDTALAEALRKPVGEWTRRWQAELVPPIQLGPAPGAGSALLGLLLAAVAVGIVLRTVVRREVR
jgi:hypothetical protein